MKQQISLVLAAIVVGILALAVTVMYHGGTRRGIAAYSGVKPGIRVTYMAQTDGKQGNTYDPNAVQRILETRLNSFGINNASVQQQGTNQFVVDMPGVTANDQVVQNLARTDAMTLYYMKDVASQEPDAPAAIQNRPIHMEVSQKPAAHDVETSFYDSRTHQSFRDGYHIRREYAHILANSAVPSPRKSPYTVPAPLGVEHSAFVYLTSDQKSKIIALNKELTQWNKLLADSPVVLTSADMQPTSIADVDQLTSSPSVTQNFTAGGAKKMTAFSTSHRNEVLGIILNDQVLSAPRLLGIIRDKGEMSGGFSTLKQAQDVANVLNAGSLPVPLKQVKIELLK